MGCAGSTNMLPATSDMALKPTLATASESAPKTELILKDLPDVVEKVIESIKEPDLKILEVASLENTNLSDLKDNALNAVKSDVKNFLDPASKNLIQGITQGVLTDNISSSASKRPPDLETLEQLNKLKNKNSPTISSDIDSLRTSSPESEIEEALANNNDQNPPTPKPTFSELQNLAVGQVNTLIKSSVKTTETFVTEAVEKIPAIDNSDKSEENNNTLTNRRDTTDWEKQADMLALTQKYNPIEAMRKFKRDNAHSGAGERNGSALILRNEFKPKIQNIFEDLNEFLPLQSPHRSRLSSAMSERSHKVTAAVSSDLEDSGRSTKNENEDNNKKQKVQEIPLKKSPAPARRTKDSYLVVPTANVSVRGVPSPSPHKVRERCAVCCNKYKH